MLVARHRSTSLNTQTAIVRTWTRKNSAMQKNFMGRLMKAILISYATNRTMRFRKRQVLAKKKATMHRKRYCLFQHWQIKIVPYKQLHMYVKDMKKGHIVVRGGAPISADELSAKVL